MQDTISEISEKCKIFLRKLNRREDWYIAALIVLVGFASFGIGRLSALKEGREPVRIEYSEESVQLGHSNGVQAGSAVLAGGIVASKHGTKYHFPWCSGARRIKEGNKVWFASEQEARAAGYGPAKNCKGLQ